MLLPSRPGRRQSGSAPRSEHTGHIGVGESASIRQVSLIQVQDRTCASCSARGSQSVCSNT
eukprot:1491596-Rhodomonas_salina.2